MLRQGLKRLARSRQPAWVGLLPQCAKADSRHLHSTPIRLLRDVETSMHHLPAKAALQSQLNGKESDTILIKDPEEITTEEPKASQTAPVLQLGDYVDVFRNGQYSGIVVERKNISGHHQSIKVVLRRGKVMTFKSFDVAFRIPGFIRSPAVTRFLKTPITFKETDEVIPDPPLFDLGRAVQEYKRDIRTERARGLRSLEQMYAHFREAVPDDQDISVTLNDLAQFAYCNSSGSGNTTPTHEQRYATFEYLVSNNVHFVPSVQVLRDEKWTLRSQSGTRRIEQLIQWIRTRDEVYTGFLERARELVHFTKAHADPLLGTFSQSSLEMAPEHTSKLTTTDAMFINFVLDWIKSPKIIVDSPHEVFVPNILKALHCYDNLFVDRNLAVSFLKDIGALKPWDNVSLYQNTGVAEPFFWSNKADENNKQLGHYANLFLQQEGDIAARDGCDKIRHDFGDLPVYTIDDPSAKEIDDGVSIERVPGQDAVWLHVHIADPTAHINPNDDIVRILRSRGQTLYLPECHFPMMPDALSSEKFSLVSSASTSTSTSTSAPASESRCAFTFSAKLDAQGNVSDYKIRPSVVKNVRKIYYDDLDKILVPKFGRPGGVDRLISSNPKTFAHPTSMPFGAHGEATSSTLLPDFEQDLIDIYHLASKHTAFRTSQGAIMFSQPSPVITLDPSPLELPPFVFTRPQFAARLPYLRVSVDSYATSPARQMVAETMMIAGRVASKFAAEHRTPFPYRAQIWPSNTTTTDQKLRQELLEQHRDPATGRVQLSDMLRFLPILPPAIMTTEPNLPHVVMGIPDGYTKATSPLRRFLDMVVHWQLKASLIGNKTPFDTAAIQTVGTEMAKNEKQLAFLQRTSIQFWVLELLRRLQSESHGHDMEWSCVIGQSNMPGFSDLGGAIEVATGTLLELGIQGRIENPGRTLHQGDVVKVRIASLDPLLLHLEP